MKDIFEETLRATFLSKKGNLSPKKVGLSFEKDNNLN